MHINNKVQGLYMYVSDILINSSRACLGKIKHVYIFNYLQGMDCVRSWNIFQRKTTTSYITYTMAAGVVAKHEPGRQ